MSARRRVRAGVGQRSREEAAEWTKATYDIAVGTILVEDSVRAPQLEAAMSVMLGLPTEQVNITVTAVS